MVVVQLLLLVVTLALMAWGQRLLLELEVVETAELITLIAADTGDRNR